MIGNIRSTIFSVDQEFHKQKISNKIWQKVVLLKIHLYVKFQENTSKEKRYGLISHTRVIQEKKYLENL